MIKLIRYTNRQSEIEAWGFDEVQAYRGSLGVPFWPKAIIGLSFTMGRGLNRVIQPLRKETGAGPTSRWAFRML